MTIVYITTLYFTQTPHHLRLRFLIGMTNQIVLMLSNYEKRLSTRISHFLFSYSWCHSFPFTTSCPLVCRFRARPGSSDFALLDTNHDGHLSNTDDMYSPYYPGDDVVDWVGLTVYYWGQDNPNGPQNIPPAPQSFYNKVKFRSLHEVAKLSILLSNVDMCSSLVFLDFTIDL